MATTVESETCVREEVITSVLVFILFSGLAWNVQFRRVVFGTVIIVLRRRYR